MTSSFMRAACALLIVSAPALSGVAMAQTPAYEKARCAQLLGYYAYYGESRRENSDGTKNGLWIAASVDCAAGRYEMGLAEIERLLTNKHFPIPGAEQASTPDGGVRPMTPSQAAEATR